MPKQKIYLVNNKPKESDFKKVFAQAASHGKYDFMVISSLDCAFSYSRTNKRVTIHHKKSELDTLSSKWFVRAWSPSEDASALLCIILELKKVPFTDAKINTKHEIRTSKLSQTFQLAAAGYASPSTWVAPLANFSAFKTRITKDLGFPLVVKARGGLGKRVWKCNTMKELTSTINQLKAEGKDDLVIIQELIQNDGDIRVVVWNGAVIASISRKNTDGFRNNVSQGGIASNITITPSEKRLAIAAAKVVGLDLAGVDLVRTGKDTLIFEVNKAPDITSFHKAAGFNIAKKIVEDFLK